MLAARPFFNLQQTCHYDSVAHVSVCDVVRWHFIDTTRHTHRWQFHPLRNAVCTSRQTHRPWMANSLTHSHARVCKTKIEFVSDPWNSIWALINLFIIFFLPDNPVLALSFSVHKSHANRTLWVCVSCHWEPVSLPSPSNHQRNYFIFIDWMLPLHIRASAHSTRAPHHLYLKLNSTK